MSDVIVNLLLALGTVALTVTVVPLLALALCAVARAHRRVVARGRDALGVGE